MLVICSLLVTINAGGIPWIGKYDTKGKIIGSSETKYLVDFSQGVKNYSLVGIPKDYSKVLIDKNDCVKVSQ